MKKGLLLVLVGLAIAGCATFDGEIPVDTLGETSYISPANADGVQDVLEISGVVPEADGLRLAGYRFVVVDETGEVVFEQREEVEVGVFARWFGLGAVQEIPASLQWAGVNQLGDPAAEGTYNWSIEVWDRRDNRGVAGPYRVVVDNTPPTAAPEAASLWFSPNGDGRLDTLVIDNRGISQEDRWNIEIKRGDDTVARYEVPGAPAQFAWDGRTTGRGSSVAADGRYQYVLSATDRAGNSFSTTLDGLALDTAAPTIVIDRSEAAFSPNGDGRKDQQQLRITQLATAPLAGYRVSIVNDRGQAFRTFSGASAVPQSVTFDGRGDAGRPIPDGRYFARLDATYANGVEATAVSDAFVIDTRAPSVAVNAAYLLFSPDGDGRKDVIPVQTSSSEEREWRSTIFNSSGSVVRSVTWNGRVSDFAWDGTDASGDLVADGVYSYEVASTDEAGNETVRRFAGIRVDTRPTPIVILTNTNGISPNGDGVSDAAEFEMAADIREELAWWTVDVIDESGTTVRQFANREGGRLPETLVWDGRDKDGRVVEGRYVVRASVEYEKGNLSVAELFERLVVDVTGPVISLGYAGLPFSPDADGNNDVLRITPTVADASRIETWSAEISDSAGNEFMAFRGRGAPAPLNWNGRSNSGELVQSADVYGVRYHATDVLGNTATHESSFPTDILVIRDGDRLRINVASIYFKPFTADFLDVEPETRARNLATLDRLAEVLGRYPDYQIRLEGHAVRLLWDRPTAWPGEEANTLGPLSLARANAIRSALAQRGIPERRMTTAGLGGTRPTVPHGDTVNRWKNRRVEFILIR